jgi:ABC-type glycerol-3-phosphate transport system permease component
VSNPNDLFITTRGQRVAMRVFLCVVAALWLLPVVSLVQNSLKVNGLQNYAFVILHPVNGVAFYRYFINSFIVALGSSFLVVFIGTLSGFAFSKINFRGKRLLFSAVIMCLAVSVPVIYVPLFYILKTLRLYNTYLAVIIPEVLLTLPFAVLMMRGYFDGFPVELMESSFLDGAGMRQVFTSIYVPLAQPALINLGVLQIMWSFQDFFIPLMFLTKNTLFTATVAVNVFRGVYGIAGRDLGRYNAALVLIGVPAIVMFAIFQRYIVSGITSGALKE